MLCRRLVLLALICGLFLAVPAWAKESVKEAKEQVDAQTGVALGEMRLKTPSRTEDLAYLGLPQGGTFGLNEIQADYVLVQYFSAYCPHCQAEAPAMNELVALVAKQGLDKKLKIIGIGPNNNDFEVDLFRQKYKSSYPLIPDPEMVLMGAVGDYSTPSYFFVKLHGKDQKPELLLKKTGRSTTAKTFLSDLKTAAKLK